MSKFTEAVCEWYYGNLDDGEPEERTETRYAIKCSCFNGMSYFVVDYDERCEREELLVKMLELFDKRVAMDYDVEWLSEDDSEFEVTSEGLVDDFQGIYHIVSKEVVV